MSKIIPVILSGSSGTSLWPLSREEYPKQYLPLAGDSTMLQETILRLNGLDNLTGLIITAMQIVKVKSGVYLGKDNIIRFKDIYDND